MPPMIRTLKRRVSKDQAKGEVKQGERGDFASPHQQPRESLRLSSLYQGVPLPMRPTFAVSVSHQIGPLLWGPYLFNSWTSGKAIQIHSRLVADFNPAMPKL
jgi:hypothetical protein